MRARIIGTVINLVVDLSKKGINEKKTKKQKNERNRVARQLG